MGEFWHQFLKWAFRPRAAPIPVPVLVPPPLVPDEPVIRRERPPAGREPGRRERLDGDAGPSMERHEAMRRVPACGAEAGHVDGEAAE